MKILNKIKAALARLKEIRRTVAKFKKHEDFFYEQAVRDYLNGVISGDDLLLYIDKCQSVYAQTRLLRKAELDAEMRIAESKLKGKALTDKHIQEAKNELYVLTYNFDSIQKTNPLTASALKAKQTRLNNLQEKIDYINGVITALEKAKKTTKQKTSEDEGKEKTTKKKPKPKPKTDAAVPKGGDA